MEGEREPADVVVRQRRQRRRHEEHHHEGAEDVAERRGGGRGLGGRNREQWATVFLLSHPARVFAAHGKPVFVIDVRPTR